MKRVFYFVFLLLFLNISNELFGRRYFDEKDTDLSVQIGFGDIYTMTNNLEKSRNFYSFSFDYGVSDDYGKGIIGLGGYVGYHAFVTEKIFEGESYATKTAVYTVAGKVTYHFHIRSIKKLDTYVGAQIGGSIKNEMNISEIKIHAKNYEIGYSLAYSGFTGIKYYIVRHNIALKAELGAGHYMPIIQAGITYKIKNLR